MGWGRVTETERMPRLVVGYTDLVGGKLKKGKGFLKPNFGVGPSVNQSSSEGRDLRMSAFTE